MSISPPDPQSRPPEPDAATAGGDDEMCAAQRSARKSVEQVSDSDELRTDKIFELRSKIASGEYKVDADSIAERLVDHL